MQTACVNKQCYQLPHSFLLNSIQCLFYVCFTHLCLYISSGNTVVFCAHKMMNDVPRLICLVQSTPLSFTACGRVFAVIHVSLILSVWLCCRLRVCWNCEVWVFVAFAVSQVCLSLSALVYVCVCVCCSVLHSRTDLTDSTFPLIHTQCTHMCTHSSLEMLYSHIQC